MLTQYKNIDQILQATGSVSVDRIPTVKTRFTSALKSSPTKFNTAITTQTDDSKIELHVYSNETWITGTHQLAIRNQIPEYIDKTTNKQIKFSAQPVAIDVYNELSKLKLTSGNFRIAVNFFRNLIGSYDQQYLRIDEISPDRTEVRLRAINTSDTIFREQITDYIQTVNQTSTDPSKLYTSYLLNFSRNQCVTFVNSVVLGEYLYVKLLDPLPDQYEVDFKCWVVEEQKPTYIDRISIKPFVPERQFRQLSNPNWYANSSYNISSETGLKNWNELLGSSVPTSQQIVDSYFSGSLSGVELNIDFSDFNNFIFYSSATERLENFKYKLQLLEYYTSQSAVVSLISGSVATTNIADFELQKTNLIGGFDAFEKYLYYESSSKLTTYEIPVDSPNVASVTGSYIQPAPKSNSTKPYGLYPVTSSQFQTWFNGLYSSASLYDTNNINALVYSIPEFIRFDQNNAELSTFVNMLGHHYDILYMYINHMTKIHKREENPKLGMPNELLYSVAKQFGWNLTNGAQNQDLWQYVLGTNEAGTPLTGSNSVGDPSVSGKNSTYAIWRRIVNNLPLLLKTKGTKRSVQALLSCYGIPQSLITIKEYGGPRLDRAPIYEKLNFDYALDLINNPAGTVSINYSQSVNTVELRFRTDNVITNPTMSGTMNLFSVGSNNVTLDYTSGTLGTIQINGTGSANIEMFDGGWLSAMVRTTGSALQVIAKRSKYGKIVAAVSASATASFALSGSVIIGGTVGGSRLEGQVQELRLWSSSLNETTFNNHVKAPAAYNGNISAYDELVFRVPLTQKINHSTTSSLNGVQPISSSISASFTGWTNNTPYDSIEETYYYDSISLGAGTYDDNKVRLEDNELVGTLDVKTRAERSQFDRAVLDSSKLGVYFSPETMIDEDIIAQLGFTDLDEYIGDPGDSDLDYYPRLIQKAQDYWKKYDERNDINSYIKIFTLFDLSFFRQLEQLLPARTDKLTGILIQPNILERSKSSILPEIRPYNNTLDAQIAEVNPSASGNFLNYLGIIDEKIVNIQASDDDQLQGYITSSQNKRYDGTIYDYEYLYWNGSEYITGSTPYWRQEGVLPVLVDAVRSEFRYVSGASDFYVLTVGSAYYSTASYYGTSSYASYYYRLSGSLASVQDYLPFGIANQKYNGSKLTSQDFNISSTDTIDGGAVVEWQTTNANQLIYQNNGNEGSFRLV